MKHLKHTVVALFVAIISAVLILFSAAYFSNEYEKNIWASAKVEVLFDRINQNKVGAGTSLGGDVVYDPQAEWGTPQNPFIISNIKHLQNLSRLQNVGWFKNNFYKDNPSTAEDESLYHTPHFRVCTSEGKPVVIDGTATTPIEPIGTAKNPFVGVVDGAFAAGTVGVCGKNSTVSAIYNIVVHGSKAEPDIGLFGAITSTGTPTTTMDPFNGTPSAVSNILLADIQVKASYSVLDLQTWESLFTGHIFQMGTKPEYHKETQHIGILAGHINYSNVNGISVYYSADTIKAIDIAANASGSLSNFYSVSGIIGTMCGMNPTTDATTITGLTGVFDTHLQYEGVGGGGVLSGSSPGYILAAELYETYHYNSDKSENGNYPTGGPIKISVAYDKDGQQLVKQVNKNYYFTDGVFTFALSSSEDTLQKIWTDQVPNIIYGAENDTWNYHQLAGAYKNELKSVNLANMKNKSSKKGVLLFASGNSYYVVALTADKADFVPAAVFQGTLTNGTLIIDTATRDSLAQYTVTVTKKGSNYRFAQAFGSPKNPFYLQTFDKTLIGIIHLYYRAASATLNKTSDYYPDFVLQSVANTTNGYTMAGANESTYLVANTTVSNGFGKVETNVNASNAGTFYFYEFAKTGPDQTGIYEDPNNSMGTYMPSNPLGNLPANAHVLWPSALSTPNGNNGMKTATPSYYITPMGDLRWKDSNGNIMTDMSHMFNLQKGIDWGIALNLWGFGSFGSKGMVTAPVGSKGTKINIPTGSIAFDIATLPEVGYAKIRVIVAVPSNNTEIHPLGFDSTGSSEDYYFGIWDAGKDASSGLSLNGFDKKDALQVVELPRSQFKVINNTDDRNEYIRVAPGTVTGGGKDATTVAPADQGQYRAYLDGEIYLVAYEFRLNRAGLFLMGASNSNMQIVYFAADGVASSGNDGTGDNQLDGIDFVYDNGTDILTVNRGAPAGSTTPSPTQYYYPSLAFVYSTNREIATQKDTYINYEQVFVRRALVNGEKTLIVKIGDGSAQKYYFNAVVYALQEGDKLNLQNGQPPSGP